MANEEDEPVEVVRRGYDALSWRYRADDAGAEQYAPWIAALLYALDPESRIVDLGCGCGVPVARDFSAAGHRVTGIDVSEVQIRRARHLVPTRLSSAPTPPPCNCPRSPTTPSSRSTR